MRVRFPALGWAIPLAVGPRSAAPKMKMGNIVKWYMGSRPTIEEIANAPEEGPEGIIGADLQGKQSQA